MYLACYMQPFHRRICASFSSSIRIVCMRFLQASAVFVGAVLLAGCGNIQTVKSFSTPYKEPDGGERARIRVVSDGMVRAVPQSACVNWRLPSAGVMVASIKGFADQNNKSLGMPANTVAAAPHDAPTVVGEFYVPANKPLALAYLSNSGRITFGAHYQCQVNKTFVPQAGKDYEARFIHTLQRSLLSAKESCVVEVTELAPEGAEGVRPEPVELRNARLCRGGDML